MRQTQINASPHAAQRQVHNCPARFRVLDAGRRWGKTRLGVMECIDVATQGGRAWWVAPSYKISEVGWRPIQRICRRIPGTVVRMSDREVTFPGGGAVAVRSADSPNGLRGEGLDFVVLDEAAFMRQEAWTSELRPSLSDKLGRALFISTPKGRNWFWDFWRRGSANEPDWAAFKFPTSANPYIASQEIEDAKRDLPEIIFNQEYMAEFVDYEGSVFRRITDAAVLDAIDKPIDGKQYSASVDVAASVDYTVITIWDVQAKHAVYFDRFNRVDYNVLEDRLESIYKRYNCKTMTIEINGIGQGVLDHLKGRGMRVMPFTTTSATKQGAVMSLQSAFEHGEIKVVNDPIMIGELLSFEAKRNASGSFAYSAPTGMHDDYVMSLAIGWQGMSRGPAILFGA